MSRVEEAIAALYRAPLANFVTERKRLSAELKLSSLRKRRQRTTLVPAQQLRDFGPPAVMARLLASCRDRVRQWFPPLRAGAKPRPVS